VSSTREGRAPRALTYESARFYAINVHLRKLLLECYEKLDEETRFLAACTSHSIRTQRLAGRAQRLDGTRQAPPEYATPDSTFHRTRSRTSLATS
jgi:hypothetical protein